MFSSLLKTSVCVSKSTELLEFLVAVRTYITTKFVTPGIIESNCYLSLITLEIVNNSFGSRSALLEVKLQPQPDP